MTTDEQLKRFEKNLAGVVNTSFQQLVEAITPQLSEREARVLTLAMTKYAAGGRWYDKWGIPDSILDTLCIVGREKKERGIIIPILALHDTGYPSLEDTARYASADMREHHMRIGAQFAAELYNWTNADGTYSFTRDEAGKIVHIVARHDDHYIKEEGENVSAEIEDAYRTFVDCDRIFVPSFISAYKDYVSRYARESHGAMTGEEFLAMRIAYFFKQEDPEVEAIGISVDARVFKDAQEKGKYEPPYLAATREVIAAHLKARKAECDGGLFRVAALGDWDAFEHHAQEYVIGSVNATFNRKSYDMDRCGT